MAKTEFNLPIDIFMKGIKESITFEDILLDPGYSRVVPADVNLETKLTENISLKIPLISADMNTVTEDRLATEIARQGGIGFLWKHPDINVQVDWVNKVKYNLNALIDKPITIFEDQTLDDVQETLTHYGNRFSSLVVLNRDNKVVGLVTGDKTQFATRGDKVKSFMVKEPITSDLEANLDINQAYHFMKSRKIGKLILVNREGELKGLYCFKDVKSIVEGENSMYTRDERGQLRVGANIGVKDLERAEKLLEARCDVILVGTAHGHSKNVVETVVELKKSFSKYNFSIVAGNVATYEGAKALFQAGADCVKVGLGPGSICTTRIVTGAGVPQVTAVYNASRAARELGKYIISDGGIKSSGDIAKILAVGANSVMIGNLFAGCEESPGEKTMHGGKIFKAYMGMGSEAVMKQYKDARQRYSQPEKFVSEGVEGLVPYTGPISEVIFQLTGGVKSGMGYVGAANIPELQIKASFNRPSTSGKRESHPDIKLSKEPLNYPIQ
jgi:IMP dehydrogenase